MADSTSNTPMNLFTASSNEHTLFAGTLRNWGDPLLQGQEPTRVPLCPRCATCRCESLRNLTRSSASRKHHHHRHHEPSCPNYHQHERAKTTSKQRTLVKTKRRANSHDPSLTLNNRPLISTPNTEYSSSTSSTPLMKPRNNKSKIPVRVSTMSKTASECSSTSSLNNNRSSNIKTKLPQPLIKPTTSLTTIFTQTNQTISSSDEFGEYDQDSLDDDAPETSASISTNEYSNSNLLPKTKRKDMMMLYCSSSHPDHFDDVTDDELSITREKKRLTPSSSSSEKRQRRSWYKEG
ncbi:unnamed protein product [Adineta ricciae]|uniref:Uncharacterized protein n=1 Tax=Adineta ricciae TaxID=249248 RepID=A0A813PUI6_ADIRI|nr:unnamed protein product [Adineta ricciae]CAF1593717.1 unnamed protein product [Adineta ricciae]